MPRRSGKDITALNYVIRRMWENPGVYYYIFPSYSQAKKVIWDSITTEGIPILSYFPKELVLQTNSQEMKIRMLSKGGKSSLFQLIGSDNHESLMGTNPIGCVFSEYALQDPTAYQYLRPILTNNKGWALFLSCVSPDTLVITENGLSRIKNVSEKRSEYSKLNKKIWGLGGFHNAERFYYGGKQKTLKIKLKAGIGLECTPIHPVWDGDDWIKAGDLKINDVLPIQYGQDVWGKGIATKHFYESETVKESILDWIEDDQLYYLLGLIHGSGYTDANYITSIYSSHPYISDFLEKFLFRKEECRFLYKLSSFNFCSLLAFIGFKENKEFPEGLFACKKDQMVSFLQGLFDCEKKNTIESLKSGVIRLSSENRSFLKDIQVILLNFGIVSSLDGDIDIIGRFAHKFYRDIGFRIKRKQECEKIYNDRFKPVKKESFYHSTVVSIENSESEVFDFVIPETHSFFSNGLISHNTPRGKNHLWSMYQIAKKSPDWFSYKLTLDDTKHIPKSEIEKERSEGIMSEDMIQQEYFCFPPYAPILTPDGIKEISDIKKDDLVFSHSGRIRRVLGTISRPYEGKMIEIKSYGSFEDIVCTPNHPIRIYRTKSQSYVWKQAQYIGIKDRVVFPKIQMNSCTVITHSLCMLMAWYITEGSSFKNGLNFSLKDIEEAKIVCDLLKKENCSYRIHKRECNVDITVSTTKLHEFLRKECGSISYNKIIPFHLISGYEEEFFYELMKGDGHKIKDRKNTKIFSYTTNSKSLAYQYQMLANSIPGGLSASVSYKKAATVTFPNGKTSDCRESYNVVIYKKFGTYKRGRSFLRRAKHGVAAKVREINQSDFSGTVHNLKVQYDESYIAYGRAVHNCSFTMGIEGSYYSKYIDRLKREDRISAVPWESDFKVHTAWDLGVRDKTSIIFFQNIGKTVRLIDCYENSKEGLEHYAKVISEKPYQYGTHIAPHDIRVREWGTGITRFEKARQLGINFTVAPMHDISDGIEACRSLFSKLWIDDIKCKGLIDAMENYRQEFDTKKRIYRMTPLHNWASHYCDSFRYLATSLPKTTDSISAEEIEFQYQEAMFGGDSAENSFFNTNNGSHIL